MRIAIVGAGPTGLYLSVALARRGHRVTVVDRDAGPAEQAWWRRNGVMQFHHPHGFRLQVIEALMAEMPEAWDALLAAGGVPVSMPDAPERVIALRCRRSTFEATLRVVASAEPGVTMLVDHVQSLVAHHGRAAGVRVPSGIVPADLVIDASGRAGRLTRGLRAPAEGGDCGIAYVSRQYQLQPGAEPGPVNSPPGFIATYSGYIAIAFPHDNGTLSALVAHASGDRVLAGLHSTAAYDAAVRAIPPLAAWTDPERSYPITPVLRGGHLYNSYRGQLNTSGRVELPGVIAVGDAVCTTNPALGRGVATSLMQARQLLRLIDAYGCEHISLTMAFDAWCREHVRPWFADHVYSDGHLQRRWASQDIDLTERLPSDLIVAAAESHPEFGAAVGPYVAMKTLPASLDGVEPQVREIYARGWRPTPPDGPDRDELAAIVTSAGTPAEDVGDAWQGLAHDRDTSRKLLPAVGRQ